MASSGNFATLNPLIKSSTNTFSNGNCRITSSSGGWGAPLTLAANTGKFYVEINFVNSDTNGGRIAVLPTNSAKYQDGDQSAAGSGDYAIEWKYDGDSNFITNNGSTTQSSVGSWAQGDVAAVAFDLDASPKTVQFYKNNSTIGSAENINTNATGDFTVMIFAHNAGTWHINAGQDSSFGGNETAGGNADGNGFGDFYYSPPSGFLALSSANLPISDDIDPAQTDDDYPSKQFNAITYTGNGSSQSITGLGFKPDFVWIKKTNSSQAHTLMDSTRGTSKALESNTTSQEDTSFTQGVTAFGTDGFSVGNHTQVNNNSDTYVGWAWRANGGTTASNSSGTITSTVQANQAAGFSIVTYTGNDGSWGSGNRDTFGHGLSAAPEFIIVKERNNTDQWTVFNAHVGNGGGSNAASNNLRLDNDEALYTNQSYKAFGATMPTSTLVTVEGNTTNSSSSNHVAYCWHSVEGFSKFGSYVGNSNNDGPFIYTGFRPRMVFLKLRDSAGDWWIYDSARDTANPVNKYISWDRTDANATGLNTDFLSNGFKLRNTSGDFNSSATILYGAWGDVSFKYQNTF